MLILISLLLFSEHSTPNETYEQAPKTFQFQVEKERMIREIEIFYHSGKFSKSGSMRYEITKESDVHLRFRGKTARFLTANPRHFQALINRLFPNDGQGPDNLSSNGRNLTSMTRKNLLERGFTLYDLELLKTCTTGIHSFRSILEQLKSPLDTTRDRVAKSKNPKSVIRENPGYVKKEVEIDNFLWEIWADHVFALLPKRLQRMVWMELSETIKGSDSSFTVNIGTEDENIDFISKELQKLQVEIEGHRQ